MSTSPAPAEDPRLNELFEAIIDGTISAAAHRPYGDLYLRFFPLHMEMEIMPTEPEDVDLFADRVLDGVSAYCLEVRDHLYEQRGKRLIALTIEVNASNGLVAISLNFDEHPQRLGGDFMPTAPVAADVLAHPVTGDLPEWLQEAVESYSADAEVTLTDATPTEEPPAADRP
jgi:hypothetical protein